MTLNVSLAIAGYDLQQGFLDKQTALPLSGGLVYFYQDLNRNNPKPIYQLTGSPGTYTLTPLPNPVTLTNAGTISDGAGNDVLPYYYPYDVAGNPDNYYVAVYAAPPMPPPPPFPPVGTPILTRQNIPGVTAATGPNEIGPESTENALTNPQFVDVYFNPAVGMTIAYVMGVTTTSIAPGWDLEITATGGGTLAVNRTSIAGSSAHVTNPPYALTIGTGPNITSLILFQRLNHNPNIWSFTNNVFNDGGFIASSITLANPAGSITMAYKPSGAVPSTTLLSASNPSGIWQTFNNTTQLPLAINTDTSDTGYVDIQIVLTGAGQVTLTSVQVIGLDTPIANIPFDQEPVNRQIDHTFNVFQPLLNYKQTPSYLIGWDFPLNPAQIFGNTIVAQATGVNTGFYAWDQTIVFQTISNSVSVARAANGGFQLTCTINGQVALIQYLDQVQARKILNDRASVRMSASTNHVGGLAGNVTLWATTDANLPNVAPGTNLTLITTLSATGIPTALSSANWVQVPNLYQNTSFTLNAASATNDENADVILNGWDMQNAVPTNTATFFAIVVGFAPWVATDTITFNSISLCPGDIPSRPAPKSSNETQRECERFYEKSYASATVPVAGVFPINTTFNQLNAPMGATFDPAGLNQSFLERSFSFSFRTLKRIPPGQGFPTVTIYSPVTGNAANVRAITEGGITQTAEDAIGRWRAPTIGDKNVSFSAPSQVAIFAAVPTQTAATPVSTYINYHYVAEARLGIVN